LGPLPHSIRITAAVLVVLLPSIAPAPADIDADVQRIVTRHLNDQFPADAAGGAAVAVRITGRTLFFNFGLADRDEKRPITSDSLFNLGSIRKVFETTLLADAVGRGELALDEPVAKHVVELQGKDIGRVTLGQLASHTSGLLLPQDHPPWPTEGYTLPGFIRTLNAWKADKDHEPGRQHIYTHAGYVLLALALERRFGTPIGELLTTRVLQPLGMHSTVLPLQGEDGIALLPAWLMKHAVQGYSEEGEAIGKPGDQQGYYHWPGTNQMFSAARDMAVFVAANLGELPQGRPLRPAMELAQRGVVPISARNIQALAWEINRNTEPAIVEKNGGLNNSSTYIGMMPERKLGIVILSNRGNQNPAEIGRVILAALAGLTTVPPSEAP
jgi:beta-lactamase class C